MGERVLIVALRSMLPVMALVGSCGVDDGDAGDHTAAPAIGGALFDYQLGGAYQPPDGTELVVRDSTAAPADGVINLCYVNGFQTQPDEADWWLAEHPDLLLRDDEGAPVSDPEWPDEMLLDISTPTNRAAIGEIVGGWISGCADDGYDGVEIDNLDTYSRSDGALGEDEAVTTMAIFARKAHAAGLLIGQKNSVELLDRRAEMGDLDFAVSEECNAYDECDAFTDVYGDAVLVIEYEDRPFEKGCEEHPDLAIIRRDLDLTTPAADGYVYRSC